MNRKMSSGGKSGQETVDCFACGHFYITYDKGFPYGCRAMGFKSRVIPSREVYSSSGIECQSFISKKAKSL
jgi:hypothetical protein